MNTPYDEWNSLSTFWLISCVLHAFILMMPIRGVPQRTVTFAAIELMDIGELTIAEATGTGQQPTSSHTESGRLTPSASQRKVSVTALRYEHDKASTHSKTVHTSTSTSTQPTPLSKTATGTVVAKRASGQERQPHRVASARSERPNFTSAMLGTLPRGKVIGEPPATVGTQALISPTRASEGSSKGADMPPSIGVALEPTRGGEGTSSGQLNEGITTTLAKGRQTSVSQTKVSPRVVSLPEPSANFGVGLASQIEAQGGYSIAGLERSRGARGGEAHTPSGESPDVTGGILKAQPQLGGSGSPAYAPSQSTRATNIAKGSPMLSDIIGSLSKTRKSNPNIAVRTPTHLEPISTEPQTKGYTGLIIDARGLKVERSMSPRIYDERGRAIYGPQFVPANFAIEKGVVYYHTTLEGALKDKRAGPQPLIIKAIGVRGTARQDVIVSQSDGETILRENAVGHFLERCNVIFIID